MVVRLPELVSTLSHYQNSHAKLVKDTFTAPLQQCAEDLEKFRQMVETTVDLEAIDNHQFLIKADFDEGLQGIVPFLPTFVLLFDQRFLINDAIIFSSLRESQRPRSKWRESRRRSPKFSSRWPRI